jgi:hypothetical protein
MNSMAWLALFVWVGVPLLALLTGVLFWRRAGTPMGKALALTVSVAVLSAPLLVSNAVKAHYDLQVRELCAKDGGVQVYETVRLPAERFDEFGDFRIPIKSNAQETDPYYYEWRVQRYRDGNPTIRRNHALVFRKSDGKLLGESINYGRSGGDLPGPWEGGTSFRCPESADITDLNKQVFIKN